MASPKKTLNIQFGWDTDRVEHVVMPQVQKAMPAFEGNSNYSLLGQHFSVSEFKQRQMIAVEDMANEPAPSGSPVTHTVSAPGR